VYDFFRFLRRPHFTLAILVDKMNEKCLQAFINGCEQADAALSEVEF
jgi:hypothetical protein